MAYAIIQEFNASGDDRSTTNYDLVSERVAIASNPPVGLIVHTAGWDEVNGVFRIFDVWESREHADNFWERLQRVLDEVMPPPRSPRPDREGRYELHNVSEH
jgi:hypothetical protein